MGKNCVKYLVFMFILIFSFNVKVNAIPNALLGEDSVVEAKELSCLYVNSPSADKVMLVQDKSGKIFVYKHKKDKSWDDLGWYVSDAIPRWGDALMSGKEAQLNYLKESEDDEEITYLESCPTAKITLNGGGLRFYKEDISSYPDLYAGSKVCLLEDNKSYAFTPEAHDYNTSSVDVSGKKCDSFTEDEMWAAVSSSGDWPMSCLYANDVEGGCHIVRFNLNDDKAFDWVQSEPLRPYFSQKDLKKQSLDFTTDAASVNADSVFNDFSGNCPTAIYVNRNVTSIKDMYTLGVTGIKTNVSFKNSSNREKYRKYYQEGINLVTRKELTNDIILNFDKIKITDCESLLGDSDDLIDLLKFILNLIKVLIPLLLVGLGTLDFAKAIFAGSEDNMKKAQAKFIKRVIIAVAIFLVPAILKLILGIASNIWDNIDPNLCGLL